MQHAQLIQALYQIGAVKFGEFVLKSGKTSKIYLDLRQIVSHPKVLAMVAESIWAKVSKLNFDILCGVPYTALPIATCISLQHNIPMVMRRKEKKDYGTKQQIEGSFKPGQTCLMVEDVITSGMSILETVKDITDSGLKVTDAVVLINREQGGEANLQAQHLNLHAALTLKDILEYLSQSDILTERENIIVKELLVEI